MTNTLDDPPIEQRDGIAALKIGDLLIDEETGEVLEWPAGSGADRLAYLTRQCVEAQRAVKAWETALNAYRAAIGRLLDDAGIDSVRTQHGAAAIRNRTNRVGRPERVPDVADRYELRREQVEAIWQCAATLDAKRLLALSEAGAIPDDAARDLIDSKTIAYVQVTAARPAPPSIERAGGRAEA